MGELLKVSRKRRKDARDDDDHQRHCRKACDLAPKSMSIASLAPFSGIAASLVMGVRKRRRWQHCLRNPEEGGLKTALSAASAATFQAIRGKGDHINDSARLLVKEELLLTDGSTFTWEYFQPVQLVQQILDKCSGIAMIYAEKL